ncbi:MAG: hypothetical protein ACRDQ7_04180 [Haloechinothrix sp.]
MRTLIVRLFEPAEGAGGVGLSGFVEDVSKGIRQRFCDAQELLDAIARVADRGTSGMPEETAP